MVESRFDILQNRRGRSDAADGGEISSRRAPADRGGFHLPQHCVTFDRSHPDVFGTRLCTQDPKPLQW